MVQFVFFVDKNMDFKKHFSSVPDHRDVRKIDHLLTDIIGLAIIGSIAGCDGFVELEEYGEAKEDWLKKYLELPNGIPSHDTMERAFRAIQPRAFAHCFTEWVKETFTLSDELFVHIDGKSSRRSGDKFTGKKMLHLVSAFAGTHHLSLAQVKVDDKTNEIKAIPEVLELLDIENKTVTIDAMGCQADIAQKIVTEKGNYILGVKENQKLLYQDIEQSFQRLQPLSVDEQTEKDHGRIETRKCTVITDLRFIDDTSKWPALSNLIRIESERIIGEQTSRETRYYISNAKESSVFFQKAIRSHWGIENRLHWVLDILFDEDQCRKRKDNAAENFALVRKIALNIIRSYKGDKKSLNRRRLLAGWRDDYLDKLLKT